VWCFTVVGVLFSLWCSKRTRTVVIRHLLFLSFVRWGHIIFQYIQINCDFTLTMKLRWFLLNLVWICLTNIQAVKLWSVVCLVRCFYSNAIDVASFFYDVILHWCQLHTWNGLSFAYLWRFLENLTPETWLAIGRTPKRHILAWFRVLWAIVRQNPSKNHFSRRVRGKNKNENKFGVIFRVFAQTYPYDRLAQFFWVRLLVCLVDIINCAKFSL